MMGAEKQRWLTPLGEVREAISKQVTFDLSLSKQGFSQSRQGGILSTAGEENTEEQLTEENSHFLGMRERLESNEDRREVSLGDGRSKMKWPPLYIFMGGSSTQ